VFFVIAVLVALIIQMGTSVKHSERAKVKQNRVEYKQTTVSPKKRLGQNFLTDQNILRKIVAAASLSPDDNVLEIGPGFGALTKPIAESVARFRAVELDRSLAEFIRTEFPTVELIEDDFLNVSLDAFAESAPLKILGNIPYSITSPILFKLIENRQHIRSAVLLMQDEVARRLSAKPRTKEYGILAVQLQAFSEVEYLFKVGKHVFKPQPDVNSAVVRLTFEGVSRLPSSLENIFREVVRKSFAMRRKTLENNLKLHFDLEDLDVSALGLTLRQRAEELSVEQFIALATALQMRKKILIA
jgi:16S rRNA (adenine1518-N6/adenine1519-N6)-dimethyltransferase